MMSSVTKQRKGKSDSTQTTTKMIKGEGKQDSVKQGDKAQPTAEQMRIAQIIDTKLEDPSLKDKIRQVMDATQKSEDEVCTALHDCDNDPDRAVNLLLEGVQSEWSTSIKKKKRGEKVKDPSMGTFYQPPQDDSDWVPSDHLDNSSSQTKSSEGRGRPRIQRSQGRGQLRGIENKENEHDFDSERDRGRRGRITNGPSRGRGGGRGGRGFGRGRPPFRRPIETWDSTATNSHEELVPGQVEDWDNEEYTGSLADSKVFTASISAETNQTEEAPTQDDRQSVHSTSPDENQSLSAVQFLSQFTSSPQTNKTGTNKNCSSVFHEPTHYGRDSFPTTYSFNSTVPERSVAPVLEDVRLPRVSSRLRARIPPPSKIPSSAVEMPPDAVGSGMALIDVQFGALDFGDSNENVQQPPGSPPQNSPSPDSTEKLPNPPTMSATESLLISSDSSFSPVRSTGSTSISQINELNSSKSSENVPSVLYQDTALYSSNQFSKVSHSQPSTFSTAFTSTQATSTSSSYNAVSSSASACANNYTLSSVGNYTNNAYPHYQGYPSYPSQSTLAIPHLHSTNSYQSGVSSQYGCNQNSVYGTAGLGSTTSSYSTPYQNYNANPHPNNKASLSSVSSSNKDFETSSPSVNLNSITQSNTISAPTLLTSTQTTCTAKPSAMSTMSKGAVVAGMPPGVPPIVGPQYIMSQGGMPYFQQPLYGYEELQLLPQQRLPPHLATGYYEVGYQPPTTREGVQYNMSDARFARADNNTSPVQVSSINQQSGTQAHQQPLMNPAAIPPAYAYFYQGSVIPGNFPYGAPTLYPVAATGTGSGHSSSSGIYGKGPATYTGGYGNYEGSQGSGGDYKTGNQVPKTQSVQTNPATSSDIALYSKTHAALSKSYEKPGFHSATPPPFTLSSQNSGIAPTGGYAPHLFIPAMTHHNTPMMHQPLHQDGTSSVSGRAQVGSQTNKVGSKANYSPSTYWTQN